MQNSEEEMAMALSLAFNKRGGSKAWGVQQTSLSQYEQPKMLVRQGFFPLSCTHQSTNMGY